MKAHKIHTVRFYKPKPKAIHCLTYHAQNRLLALSRENGQIDIYNFANPSSPLLQQSIVSKGEEFDRSIEALAFVPDGRLFSVGLQGFVFQHFVCSKTPERSQSTPEFWPVTSGAAWCMKYNEIRHKLAVGTEEGFVCIFDVVKDGLCFDKIFDKQEGRILSLDWHKDGFHIVTGSIDTIRIWDVESGLPLQRMSTGRLEKNLETTVWSVTILKDFTIVSGDSRGKTSFWNGKTGTLIDSYQSHKADILTVAANEEENVVYSSGVDPSIVHFQPLKKGEGKSKWMKSINRNVNTHDVHAILALAGTRGIASVGVDGNLFVDDPKFKSLKKYPPFQWGNNVSVAPDAGLFALKYDNNIEVWSLDNNDDQPPTKVLDIKVKEVESIANSAIAPNGKFLAYSTKDKFKLLKISVDPPRIAKVDLESGLGSAAALMKFSNDKLVLADHNGKLKVVDLINETVVLSKQTNVLSHLDIAKDASKIITSDYQNNIEVFDLINDNEWKIQCKIPLYNEAPVSCLAMNPKSSTLVVTYSNHHFVECCLQTGKYTKLTNTILENKHLLPKEWKTKPNTTKGILFPQSHLAKSMVESKNDTIIFYDEKFISVLDRSVVDDISKGIFPTSTKQAKVEGQKKSKSQEEIGKNILRMSTKYQHLLCLATLKPEHDKDPTCPLLAIEVKPEVLERQLPPSLKQKKFGAH